MSSIIVAGECLKAKGLIQGEVTRDNALKALQSFVASQSRIFVDPEHHAQEVINLFGSKVPKQEVKVDKKPEIIEKVNTPNVGQAQPNAAQSIQPKVKVIAPPPKKDLAETVED